VELVVAGPALVEGQAGQGVTADHATAGLPLLVGGDRDDDPLLLPGGAGRALGGPARGAGSGVSGVLLARERGPRERPPGPRGRAFALGQIDERALAGAAPLRQRQGHGRRGLGAADRVAVGDARLVRLVLAVVAGERGEAAHQLDHGPEPDELAVGARLPE